MPRFSHSFLNTYWSLPLPSHTNAWTQPAPELSDLEVANVTLFISLVTVRKDSTGTLFISLATVTETAEWQPNEIWIDCRRSESTSFLKNWGGDRGQNSQWGLTPGSLQWVWSWLKTQTKGNGGQAYRCLQTASDSHAGRHCAPLPFLRLPCPWCSDTLGCFLPGETEEFSILNFGWFVFQHRTLRRLLLDLFWYLTRGNLDMQCFLLGNRYSEGKRIFSPLHMAGAKEVVTVLVGWESALASEHTDTSASLWSMWSQRGSLRQNFNRNFYSENQIGLQQENDSCLFSQVVAENVYNCEVTP